MKTFLTLFIILSFFGCSTRTVQKSIPIMVVFKTPTLKFQGTGFLNQKGSSIEVNLYCVPGEATKLLLSKRVCINSHCLSYEAFNKRFLSPFYPKKILLHIFKREPIFQGRYMKRGGGKIVQKISGKYFDIIYRIQNRKIYFKDKKNHIFIIVKELNE